MNKYFKEFNKSPTHSAPDHISKNVLKYIDRDLNPDKKIVFSKLLSIQAFIGLITMTFCPQFSLSLTSNYDLFHYFHHTFGNTICMLICGSIFMGSATIFACFLLSTNELRLIRNSKGLFSMSISILCLGVFFLFGAEIYSSLTLVWLIGCIGSGMVLFEINNSVRTTLRLG